ncbi:hypothetical protein BDR03DRAFT_958614 [Suillus americanus]|nr:hypothetical protein BDR03DRAFT_958614 [Suillus americanus]
MRSSRLLAVDACHMPYCGLALLIRWQANIGLACYIWLARITLTPFSSDAKPGQLVWSACGFYGPIFHVVFVARFRFPSMGRHRRALSVAATNNARSLISLISVES